MAKKKKFNKRVLIVLAIAALFIGAMAWGYVLYRSPGNPATSFAKAQAAFDKGDYYEARRLAGKAVQDITRSSPDSPQVVEYTYKAALLNLRVANEGKPPITQHERDEAASAAFELLKATVRLDSKHVDAQKKICDLLCPPEAHVESLPAARADQFIPEADKYIKLKPDDDDMIYRRARANEAIYFRMGGGDSDKAALEDFERLLALKPDVLQYWKSKASLLWDKKDHAGALAVMEAAVAKNPDSANFLVEYANFLGMDEATQEKKLKKGEEPKSQLMYEKAIALQPDNIVGYLALANVLVIEQKYTDATTQLGIAAQKDPCDFRPYWQAADAYERSAAKDTEASQRSADKKNAVDILRAGLARINNELSKWNGSAQTAPAATSAPSGTAKASTDKNRMEDGQFKLTAKLATTLVTMAGSPDESANRQALLKEASDLGADLNKYRTNCPEYSKVMGGVAIVEKKYAKAAELLEEASARFEQMYRSFDIQTASWLANAYLAQGRTGDAQKVLESIRKFDQKDVRPLLELTGLSIGNGDFNRAKEFVATVLAMEPKNEQALSVSAALDIADASVPPAKLPAWMKFSEPVLQVLFQKARTFDSEQEHHAAVQLLEMMWDHDPHNTSIFSQLLNNRLAAHETVEAKDVINRAKKRFADSPDLIKALQKNEQMIFAPNELERYRLRLAAADAKEDPFAKAIAKSGAEADYSNMLPASDNEKYVHAEASVNYLKDALALKPDSLEVLSTLLQHYVVAHKWAEGQAIVDKLAGVAADDPAACNFIKGQFLLAKGVAAGNAGKADVEAAQGLLRDGLKDKVSYSDGWSVLGDAYMSSDQYAQAEDAYEHALKIDPGHVSGTIGMAKAKHALLKMAEYEELIKRAYRLAPENAWVKSRYLDIIAPTATPDQLARLIKQCEENRKRNSDDIDNNMRLARLYEQAKQVSNAEQLYVELYTRSANKSKLAAAELLVNFYVRNKKQSDAQTCIHELLNDPNVDQVVAHILWGRALASTETAQAELAFKKAIELKPDDPRAQLALATFYAQQPNRMKDAADVLAKYVAAQKDPPAEIKRRLITYLLEAGQYNQAGKMISEMLAAAPADFEARELNGQIFLRQNKPAEAIEQFDQALAINPSHVDSLRLRGIAQLQKGDKRKALEDIGRAAEISKDRGVEMLLVDVALSLKDYETAEKTLRAMIDSHSDDMEVVRKLAGVYIAQAQKDLGWERLEKLITDGEKSNPKEPTYYEIGATMWAMRNQPAKQIEALKALLASPEPAVAATALEKYIQVLQSTNQYDKMSDLIEQYIQKDGFDWLKAYQGYIALKRNNNPAQAEKYFAKAVLSASHDQVAGVLAEIEQAYGKSADAAEKSSQWVKQRANDNDGPAWEQLGLEYARARNIPLAQDAYQTALKNSSGEEKARICYSAGRVYYDLAGSETGAKRGELFALSEKAYLESLSLSPANKDALNDLAFLYVEDLNQPDKALPYAEKAYNLSPSVAAVADTYAWTLAKLKRYDEAGGILSQVIQTQESLPPFHYHLGWVYEQTGQYDKAMQEYRKALDTANDKDPLRDLVKPAIERVRNKSVAP